MILLPQPPVWLCGSVPPGPFGKQLPGSASGATCLLGWQEKEYPTGTLPLPLRSEVLSPMSLDALLALLGYRIAGAIEMGVVAGHACEPMKRC